MRPWRKLSQFEALLLESLVFAVKLSSDIWLMTEGPSLGAGRVDFFSRGESSQLRPLEALTWGWGA